MFRPFSRRKAEPAQPALFEAENPPDQLRLAHDDRDVFYETGDATKLARRLLGEARDKCKDEPVGFETTVEAPHGYEHVHNMELLLALMTIDTEYDFRAGVMFNNIQYLTKIA